MTKEEARQLVDDLNKVFRVNMIAFDSFAESYRKGFGERETLLRIIRDLDARMQSCVAEAARMSETAQALCAAIEDWETFGQPLTIRLRELSLAVGEVTAPAPGTPRARAE